MNRRNIVFCFILLLVLLTSSILMMSCESGQELENMRIVLEKDVSRTLVPDNIDLNVTDYEVIALGPNDVKYTFNIKKSSFLLENVPIGNYTLTAVGYNSSKVAIVQGSTEFNLSKTNTTATITLAELVGNGHLNLAFTWDQGSYSTLTVNLSIKGQDNELSYNKSASSSNGSATFSFTDIPAGSYVLMADLVYGNEKIASVIEAIRIVGDQTTNGNISFSLDEESETVGMISLINKAGTPVECTITGLDASGQEQAQEELVLTFDPGTIPVEDLTVNWYYDGVAAGEGTEFKVTPAPGMHRIDVVARTVLLASTGSTSLTFEAALLGEKGEPVLAGKIENGTNGVAVGGRTNIDFTPTGLVIVTSDKANTATVAEVVKNTLVARNSIEMEGPAKQVLALNVADAIAILYDEAHTTATYTLNSSTWAIGNMLSDGGHTGARETSSLFEGEMIGLMQYTAMPRNLSLFNVVAERTTDAAALIGRNPTASAIFSSDSNNDPDVYSTGVTYSFYNTFDITNSDDYCFASTYDGKKGAYLIKSSGMITAFRFSNQLGGAYGEAVEALKGATALAILPHGDEDVARLLIAKDATFEIYDIDITADVHSVTHVKSIERTGDEGSGTTSFVLSHDGEFLYALNTGSSSISTYKLNETFDTLSFVSHTDAGISVSKGAISRNGSYLIVTDAGGSNLTMFRIKTTE